jgi:hypothetical protein
MQKRLELRQSREKRNDRMSTGHGRTSCEFREPGLAIERRSPRLLAIVFVDARLELLTDVCAVERVERAFRAYALSGSQ